MKTKRITVILSAFMIMMCFVLSGCGQTTLEKYVKDNPSEQKEIESSFKNDVTDSTYKIKGNDIILNVDLDKSVQKITDSVEKFEINDEFKNSMKDSLKSTLESTKDKQAEKLAEIQENTGCDDLKLVVNVNLEDTTLYKHVVKAAEK